MKIINLDRGNGKTTDLIKISSEKKIPILCASRRNLSYIKELAKYMQLHIPDPIVVDDFNSLIGFSCKNGLVEVLIDDIELFIRDLLGVNVLYATTSSEILYS